jgi:hypothetical protein
MSLVEENYRRGPESYVLYCQEVISEPFPQDESTDHQMALIFRQAMACLKKATFCILLSLFYFENVVNRSIYLAQWSR